MISRLHEVTLQLNFVPRVLSSVVQVCDTCFSRILKDHVLGSVCYTEIQLDEIMFILSA